MNRKTFLQNTTLLSAGLAFNKFSLAQPSPAFPEVRWAPSKRHFRSDAIENAIKTFQSKVKNKSLMASQLFSQYVRYYCFYSENNGRPDTTDHWRH